MGQLEKYGLYVLCLVIFLILGVTIWGEPDGVRPDKLNPTAAMNASRELGGPSGGTSGAPSVAPSQPSDLNRSSAGVADATLGGGRNESLSSLLQPPADFGKEPAIAKRSAVGGAPISGDQPKMEPQPKLDPQPKAEPVLSSTREYKVRKGDTLEGIASRELGSRSRLSEIQQLNPGLEAKSLQIGQTIKLPGNNQLPGNKVAGGAGTASKAAAPVSGGEALQRAGAFRDYKVGKGDTLDRIARLELGSSSRIEDIKQLNPGLDPRKLQIGQKIRLPIR